MVQAPAIRSVRQLDGFITLTWEAIPSRTYRVQYKDELSQPSWVDISGDVVAQSSTASKTVEGSAADQRFYRIIVVP